jgi:putative DNA primase/helicase
MTKQAGTSFDAKAVCPRWLQFLTEITGSDPEVVAFLQRGAGYALTGDTRDQHLFVAYGTGANGKTTFLNLLNALLSDYSRTVPPEVLMANRYQGSSGPREDILRLKGSRLVLTTEVGDGRVLNEDLVKRMTGGDKLVGRLPYARRSVEFTPAFKPWMATNYKPIIKGDDDGIWRRMLLIPFEQRFTEADRDPNLFEKLRAELPGVLNWAIEGCREWQRTGLAIPPAVRAASDGYRDEMDLLADWIETRCDLDPNAWTSTTELHGSYRSWLREVRGFVGANREELSIFTFGRKLSARGLENTKRSGNRGFRGIRTKDREDKGCQRGWWGDPFGQMDR